MELIVVAALLVALAIAVKSRKDKDAKSVEPAPLPERKDEKPIESYVGAGRARRKVTTYK